MHDLNEPCRRPGPRHGSLFCKSLPELAPGQTFPGSPATPRFPCLKQQRLCSDLNLMLHALTTLAGCAGRARAFPPRDLPQPLHPCAPRPAAIRASPCRTWHAAGAAKKRCPFVSRRPAARSNGQPSRSLPAPIPLGRAHPPGRKRTGRGSKFFMRARGHCPGPSRRSKTLGRSALWLPTRIWPRYNAFNDALFGCLMAPARGKGRGLSDKADANDLAGLL